MGAEAGADYPKFWFMMPFVLFVFHIFFTLPLVFTGTIYVESRILHRTSPGSSWRQDRGRQHGQEPGATKDKLAGARCDPSKTETDGGGEASTTNHPGEV